ncbi:MAG: sigma-54 dependent transcriptional regulator [Acidaminococcales bacterium]|jgi:DNA-binding NtrC family response regulator|nr:sigma-54 dependent transcriptional regulator [Acidaminococcales bacterium]
MKILIIDDEISIRHSLKIQLLKLKNVQVLTAESGEKGMEILRNDHIDLAIVDIRLPGISGLDVLTKINESKINTLVIMITFMNEVKLAVKAMKMGAYDYFTKPFSIKEVSASIENVLGFIEKRASISTLEENLFIGSSKQVHLIKETIARIVQSRHNTNILIQGKSGTGKEVIANFIKQSFQGDKEFVVLNCAAIPKTLQESELFGYEKGAFTEARNPKAGLLDKANKGLLFLDEIGDMDLELQAKLLRVLENKKYRRVGGIQELDFDALIIAATNKDLQAEIAKGHFRMDLFFRLNIIPIYLPPLRERREDIPLLVDYFISFYKERIKSPIMGIRDDAMQLLVNYEWLGNVRELKNTIERIILLSPKNYIDVTDLPDEIINNRSDEPISWTLENNERKVIVDCLEKYNYNISRAADELAVTRTTLRNKMQRYGIVKNKK